MRRMYLSITPLRTREFATGRRPLQEVRVAIRPMDAGGARIDNANFKADGETLVGGRPGTNTAVAPTPSISRRAMSSISSSMAAESVPPMPATYSWTFIRLMDADAGLAMLANIYLAPLDRLMADHGYRMVRYADDFVILCRAR